LGALLSENNARTVSAVGIATGLVFGPMMSCTASRMLGQQSAIKATKGQLQAQGLKPQHFAHRDLVTRTEAYLANHREEQWLSAGKRKASSECGRHEPQGFLLCRIPVQNEERKMIISRPELRKAAKGPRREG
jgi:hypothetical protein